MARNETNDVRVAETWLFGLRAGGEDKVRLNDNTTLQPPAWPLLAALARAVLASFVLLLAAQSVNAEPVRIGFPADSVDYAPAYAAERLSLFKQRNLEVKLITFRGGAAVQEALNAGAADIICYFGPAVALAVSKGAKEKFVMTALAGAVGWNLIVKADSPFKTVKDLDGRKVGISTKASTSDMAALWVAERAGITIQQVPLGAGLAPGLRSGQVDAIVFSALTTWREILAGHARSLVDIGKDMPPTLANGYVASEAMMAKRPAELRATLAAILEAVAYMKANREWSLNFLKEFAKSDNAELNAALYKQVVEQISADGRIDGAWIDTGLKLAARAWDVPELAKVDAVGLFSNEFLPGGK
jgi:NitT/TauT family transport system substrate-binding protein